MQQNKYDSWADIYKGNYSAITTILSVLGIDDVSDFKQSTIDKNRFAKEYSQVKREVFEMQNNHDWNFCIAEGSIIKSTSSNGNISYQYPSNFLRFLHTDTARRNTQIIYQEKATQQLAQSGSFKYVSYVKDSNNLQEKIIPDIFYEMVASRWLSKYSDISKADKMFYYMEYLNFIRQARLECI